MATLPTIVEAEPRPEISAPTRLAKLLHLQILRCIAASLVVVDHTILILNGYGAPTTRFTVPAYVVGHIGVSAFFVVSGLIMMRQSSDQFDLPGSPLRFAWHRLIRIVPLYWVATLLRFYSRISWHQPTTHAKAQLLLSLAFIPDFLSGKASMQPILDVGWTLNYEMSFYLLFALCLFFPRRIGVFFLILIPIVLVKLHRLAHYPLPQDSIQHPGRAFWDFYTDPAILLFAFGVFIGYLELKAFSNRRFRLSLSPAFVLALAGAFILAHPSSIDWTRYWTQTAWFGAVCAVFCTVVMLNKPGWLNRFLVLLGDASYSIYLFHLWVLEWIIPRLITGYHHFHSDPKSPTLAIGVCVVAASLVGLGIHLAVERPLTRALRRIKLPPNTKRKHAQKLNPASVNATPSRQRYHL